MMLLSLDNELMVPIVIGTALFFTIAIGLLLFLMRYHKAQQKMIIERQQHQQELLKTEIEIREETLKSVARELHDNLGQVASLIKINLNLVSTELPETDRKKIDESIDLLKQLIGDIKSISLSLSKTQQINLLDALNRDIQRVNRTGQLQVNLTIDGNLPLLGSDTALFLYRICQESLNNILKHAYATEAKLSLTCASTYLNIEIEDNGKGFDSEQTSEFQKGSGLTNLVSRSEKIGASCKITSKIGEGTKICINLPL